MINLSKKHDKDVVSVIDNSLYSKDVKASIYAAFLLNYGYDRNVLVWIDRLEYDVVDEGLFIGGKYNNEQNKSVTDLCDTFYDRFIGGEPSEAYKEIFFKVYGFAKSQF